MANKFIHAIFDDDDKLLDAVKYLKKEGVYLKMYLLHFQFTDSIKL